MITRYDFRYRTTHLPSLISRFGNVVAVGLSGTNPKEVLPRDGRLVSVPYYYDESHIRAIVRAIVEPKTTTKKAPSTTPNSAIRVH
ncbi:unnamed protein product [Cylicocyclus nassatus]|uniref:Uncharacterized protein n=1 Tax=Cylicocyclus nassatus TaxID=53992 RepID=A0AA36H741_CYLNA|nr:unnamed protein product [Cylicocyclus nassatus]